MLNKYGAVMEAATDSSGHLVLNSKPLAYLGPGRPLGAQYDAGGNLIICDAFKVGGCSRSSVREAEADGSS